MKINERENPGDIMVRAWQSRGGRTRIEVWQKSMGPSAGLFEMRDFSRGDLCGLGGPYATIEAAEQYLSLGHLDGMNRVSVPEDLRLSAQSEGAL